MGIDDISINGGISPSNFWTMRLDGRDEIGGIPGTASASGLTYSGGNADFNGTSGVLNVDHTSMQDGFTYYTVAVWFRPTDVNGSRFLYDEGDNKCGVALRLNGSTLEAAFTKNGTQMKLVGSSVVKDAWQLAVLTYHNGAATLYLNGSGNKISKDTKFGSIPGHSAGAAIGAIQGSAMGITLSKAKTGHFFKGQIDEARIYDGICLTESEITALWNSGSLPVD